MKKLRQLEVFCVPFHVFISEYTEILNVCVKNTARQEKRTCLHFASFPVSFSDAQDREISIKRIPRFPFLTPSFFGVRISPD